MPNSGSRPRVRSKWVKGGRRMPLELEQDDRKREEAINDIAQHCKSLKGSPSTWFVDYSER
jgi:hypothetical protein